MQKQLNPASRPKRVPYQQGPCDPSIKPQWQGGGSLMCVTPLCHLLCLVAFFHQKEG